MVFSFVVDGEPKGQPRARAARVGNFVRMYTPGTAADYKDRIRAAAKEKGLRGKLLEGPIRFKMVALFSRPKSHFRSNGKIKPTAPVWHISKPDADNAGKAALDALTSVGVWKDDSQISQAVIEKRYTDTFPHTIIEIECLSNSEITSSPL